MDYTEKYFERNPRHAPMVSSDFYSWLGRPGNYHDDILACKTAYLSSLGFVKGVDKVSPDALRALGFIFNTYFCLEVLPRIRKSEFVNTPA